MRDYELVLKAAERILKMDYPNDLTEEERLERFNEDAAFCAAFTEDILCGLYRGHLGQRK